ncbi:MAG: LysO family transporter [Deltaproteobacteria bacterium]|nr:LysO family transporter [Deltaproteobacteria bacterium]
MIVILTVLTGGIILGFLMRNHEMMIRIADRIMSWSIYLLLFLLGISVGVNETIIRNIHTIGVRALVLTAGGILGSVIVSYIVSRFFFRDM